MQKLDIYDIIFPKIWEKFTFSTPEIIKEMYKYSRV